MATPYSHATPASGGSYGGKSYSGATPNIGDAATPKKGGGGTLGGNFLRGGLQAIEALPDVAATVATSFKDIDPALHRVGTRLGLHPETPADTQPLFPRFKKIGSDVGKGFSYSYGPLAAGDFDEFYRRFHADPFAVVADVATLGAFGASRVAALATLPKGATRAEVAAALRTGETQGPLRTIGARLSPESAPIPVRTLPRKAARAARIQATDTLLKRLPPQTPLVGEFPRAARAVRREALPVKLRNLHDSNYRAYRSSFNGLSVAQRAAANAIPRWPRVEDARAALGGLARLGKDDSALAKELGNPAVWKLYTERPAKVMRVVELGRTVAGLREQILLRTGALAPDTVAEAPFRHTRLARGARYEPDLSQYVRVGNEVGKLTGETPQGASSLPDAKKIPVARDPVTGYTSQALPVESFSRLMPRGDYLYHSTSTENLGQIRREGLTPGRERRGEETGVYFAENGVGVLSLRPGNRRASDLLLRAKRSDLSTQTTDMFEPGSGFEEHVSTQPVPASALEYLGVDDRWHPLSAPDVRIDVLRPKGKLAERDVHPDELTPVVSAAEIPFLHRRNLDTRLVGGPSAEDLRAEFEAAGLPQPYYLHDIAEAPSAGIGSPSGLTAQRKGADVRQAQGVLAGTGRLLLHPDTTGPSFIRAAKHEWYAQTHEIVKQIAVRVPEADGLPKGHRWVRELRGQKIPYLQTVAGENTAELESALRALPEQQPLTLHAGENAAMAAREGGARLAVPESFARAMDAEFRQASRVIQFLERYPMALWRALVLKVRVPWLVGNLFGNSVLATLRFAGPGGLRAVLGMIRTTRGLEAARRALKLAEESGSLTSEDVARLLPELSRGGTFIGSNLPSLGSERLIRQAPTRLEPILRKAHRLGSALVDFLPHVDRATEGALRRAGATKVALASPEVRALVKQGLAPRAAIVKAIEESEDFRRLVVKEVNDGLGDYLSMSHAEATHVRALIPFYAWLREITRITLRLPLDYPGRTDLLARLSTINAEERSQRPSFLSGFIPTGSAVGGIQSGLNLTPFNPLHSAADTMAALATLTAHPSRRGASSLLGSLNPLVPAGVDYLERARRGEAVPNLGLLAAALQNVGSALPEARVVSAPPSPLYPGRTREDLLRQFLGDPRRRISVPVAEKYARQGR